MKKYILVMISMLIASSVAAVDFDWAVIGNAGNDADDTGYGAVSYTYKIATTEVTNSQYREFLNAVATTDTYGLYNDNMGGEYGGITQNGSSGNFSYNYKDDDEAWASRPVGYISWYDALRFVNWLNNDQPTGLQDATTTEYGVYDMSLQSTDPSTIVRLAGADYWLPSEDEWYKAAYYNPQTGAYYDYATGTDTQPDNNTPDNDSGNSVNYKDETQTLGSPYYSTEVGAYDDSESPYGTYDQNGNVWEWNEALIGSSNRCYRGGGWNHSASYLRSTSRYYFGSDPNSEFSFVGLRIASPYLDESAIPEPMSIGLTLLSLGGLFMRKIKRA